MSTAPKSSIQSEQDKQRNLYALAFVSAAGMKPYHDEGSQRVGFVRDEKGKFELHASGVPRRYSVIACEQGKMVWISESVDFTTYEIQIQLITRDIESTFLYTRAEMEEVFQQQCLNVDRQKALESFRSEVIGLSDLKLVDEYEALKGKVGDGKNSTSVEAARLKIVEGYLGEKLKGLLALAFEGKGDIGRKLYVKILGQQRDKKEIPTPQYWLAKFCTSTGYTFLWKTKELVEQFIKPDLKLPADHADYPLWSRLTCDFAALLIRELEAQKSKSAPVHPIPPFLKLVKK